MARKRILPAKTSAILVVFAGMTIGTSFQFQVFRIMGQSSLDIGKPGAMGLKSKVLLFLFILERMQ